MKIDDKAFIVANEAHGNQVDKNGQVYICHPFRVASKFTEPSVRSVAFLHDVVEDTSVTLAELSQVFPAEIVLAVDAITKRKHETRKEYLIRVKQNEIALKVKLADIEDNLLPWRLKQLNDKTRLRLKRKYSTALNLLKKEI